MLTEEQIIDTILEREGGATFTNKPTDRGGPTKYGITAGTLGDWRKLGRAATADEVAQLEEAEAREIYRARYVPQGIDSDVLRGVIADCATLHGQANATRMLQRALGGLVVDGVLGPKTRAVANAMTDPTRLARLVQYDRLKFIGRLISRDLTDEDRDGIPDATENASGWVNRVCNQLVEIDEL